MKIRIATLSLLLCLTLLLAGCMPKPKDVLGDLGNLQDFAEKLADATAVPQDKPDVPDVPNVPDQSVSSPQAPSVPGTFDTISDIADEWSRLNNLHEQAVNDYQSDRMPLMELVTPGMGFISGVQYDLLNMQNADGRFEGELMLAGWPGFIERKGAALTFGYDGTRKEDGFSPNDKTGDRLVENGHADLSTGLYISDSHTERDGEKINRNYYEFLRLGDGSMVCIQMTSRLYSYNGDKDPASTLSYMRIGENRFDFIVSTSQTGTDTQPVSLNNQEMTKEQAMAAFEAAGFTPTESGSLKDGKLVAD